jgi:acyl CoA:acetate/3-ketoacid CoA transferase alpha subunit
MTRVWRDGLIIGVLGFAFVGLCVLLVSMVRQDRADLTRYCKPRGYAGASIDKFAGYLCLDANGNAVQIKDHDWRGK